MAGEITERRQMKMHDMKRTPKDKKTRDKEMSAASPMDGDYHYGLRLHLDDDSMNKIGMKDNPKPGEVYHVIGHARVTRSEQSADANGKRRSVELHFTHLGAKKKGAEDEEKGVRGEIEDAVEKAEKKGSDAGGSKKDRKAETVDA